MDTCDVVLDIFLEPEVMGKPYCRRYRVRLVHPSLCLVRATHCKSESWIATELHLKIGVLGMISIEQNYHDRGSRERLFISAEPDPSFSHAMRLKHKTNAGPNALLMRFVYGECVAWLRSSCRAQ
jgi:hypothetical protein